jgi:hypothetical protein
LDAVISDSRRVLAGTDATLARVFLASEVTANVTGVNYIIDGGLIKTT